MSSTSIFPRASGNCQRQIATPLAAKRVADDRRLFQFFSNPKFRTSPAITDNSFHRCAAMAVDCANPKLNTGVFRQLHRDKMPVVGEPKSRAAKQPPCHARILWKKVASLRASSRPSRENHSRAEIKGDFTLCVHPRNMPETACQPWK